VPLTSVLRLKNGVVINRRAGVHVFPSSVEVVIVTELPPQPPTETVTYNSRICPSAARTATGFPSFLIYRRSDPCVPARLATAGSPRQTALPGGNTAVWISTSFAPSRLPANQNARIPPSFSSTSDGACV